MNLDQELGKATPPRPGPRTQSPRPMTRTRAKMLSLRTTKDQGQGKHNCSSENLKHVPLRPVRQDDCGSCTSTAVAADWTSPRLAVNKPHAIL